MIDTVWYAAYGSNLSATRFACYLRGGCPQGAAWADAGCADPTPCAEDRPIRLDRRLRFGGRSTRWDGGVAFLAEEPDASMPTLGRTYLLRAGQFDDVLAQENRGRPGAVSVDLDAVVRSGRVDLGSGWYRTVLALGEIEGAPVLTITGSSDGDDLPPSAAYLRHMAEGLRESHGLGPREVVEYLLGVDGVAGAIDRDALASMLG